MDEEGVDRGPSISQDQGVAVSRNGWDFFETKRKERNVAKQSKRKRNDKLLNRLLKNRENTNQNSETQK